MYLLATKTAWDRFAAIVQDAAPDIDAVTMAADGTLVARDGEAMSWEECRPEVVWATADLFDEGAPLVPFFAYLTRHGDGVQWLQSPAAGVDAPVFADLLRRGVRLTTSHVTAIPIAEYVLRAVLHHYQRAEEWQVAQRTKDWRRHDFREVHGSTWLVIGMGAIGSAVAERARAFGAIVIGSRRSPTGTEPVDEMVAPDQVGAVLARADVVVLAAPATDRTRSMVDATFLAAMRPGSLLVNVARGALVDEVALLTALDRGVPKAAVLDVFDTEPLPPDSPLWAHERVTVTPHGSAGGDGRYQRAAELFADNLSRYRRGEALCNEVRLEDIEP